MTGVQDARGLLLAGADKVAINRAAFDDPEILTALAAEFGAQAVVCAIDARGGEVVTHAGRRPRGRAAVDWAREAVERGAGEILLTSIDADGTRAGYDLELTTAVADAVEVPVIASGGLASMADIERLTAPDCAVLAGAITGRALYDGRIDPVEALALLSAARREPA